MLFRSGYLGLLLSAAVLFGFVTTYYRIPQQFTELFVSFSLSPYWILLIVARILSTSE